MSVLGVSTTAPYDVVSQVHGSIGDVDGESTSGRWWSRFSGLVLI